MPRSRPSNDRPIQTLLTIADVAAVTDTLDVACTRCDRRGRLSMARLLREYGPGATMRQATESLNADCPRRDDMQLRDRCDLYHPDLPDLMRAGR